MPLVQLGIVPLWTPLNLGANGAGWYDPSDLSIVTLSGVGTIAGVSSKIGPASSVTQPIATQQPIIGTLNNLSTLHGDGSRFLGNGAIAIDCLNGGLAAFFNISTATPITTSDAAGNHHFDFGLAGGTGNLVYACGGSNITVSGPNLIGGPHIAVVSTTIGVATPRIDGTAFTTAAATANTTTSIGIGSLAQSNLFPFIGDIGDVIYMASPTPSQILKVEGYLAWKWNTVSLLPSNHPYKLRAPIRIDP
jgi:hypothetical protein